MRRPARKSIPYKGETITRLSPRRFQVRIKDTAGKTMRLSYPTLEEAKVRLDEFLARKARGERFLATSAHTTFADACQLRIDKMIHAGRSMDAIDNARRTHAKHFKDFFADKPLSWFVDERMQAVKEWMTARKDEGYKAGPLVAFRKEFKRAFDAAIEDGKLAPPNPVSAFGVSVPYVESERRAPMEVEHITALVGAAATRWANQRELVARARFVMVVLGLAMPLRDQDLCGLCWDYVDLDGRLIHLKRTVVRKPCEERATKSGRWKTTKRQWVLVDTTKTGESGKGEIHMSPAAHAVLTAWRDLLRDQGFPTSGRVPVVRTDSVAMLNPDHLGSTHVTALMLKAGLLNEDRGNLYTWYNLRHTVPSIWRAIGMDLDDIKDRMRHTKLETTETYRHRVPEYVKLLRPEVEHVMDELDLQKTADGLIDALSLVLVRMWRQAGVDVPCSPPTTMRRKRLTGPRPSEPAALDFNGTTIEGTAEAVTMNEPAPPPMQQLLLSPWQMRELRAAEAKRLFNPPHNWPRYKIAKHLGLDKKHIARYLNEPDDRVNLKRLNWLELRQIKNEMGRMLDAGATTQQIEKALNVPRERVANFARRRGTPGPLYRSEHKLGRHEAEIRAMHAKGASGLAIAKQLDLVPQSVYAFFRRHGLKTHGRRGTNRAQSVNSEAATDPEIG